MVDMALIRMKTEELFALTLGSMYVTSRDKQIYITYLRWC